EMDGVEGARVHRGWWVARAAVSGVERRGRAVWLRLANGLEAPVARNAVADLREQGWL
ncbi:MAG: LytTR family transcriptional regulator DNA-binding domain-containing protein, partial [Sphingomonadales bacterium]|nr:LytTR family transcriptional regulator DNA-binding domain-containing protein [Sphingomonadales bacterium]